MRREAETLGIFAHYFKSLEYKRFEASTEKKEIKNTGKRRRPYQHPMRHAVIRADLLFLEEEIIEYETFTINHREKAMVEALAKYFSISNRFFPSNVPNEYLKEKYQHR